MQPSWLTAVFLMVHGLAAQTLEIFFFIILVIVSLQEGASEYDRCYNQSGAPQFCRPPLERLKVFNATASNTGRDLIFTSLEGQCIDPRRASNETAAKLARCSSPKCSTALCAVDDNIDTNWRSEPFLSTGEEMKQHSRAWLRVILSQDRDYQLEKVEIHFSSAAARPALMHVRLSGSHSAKRTFTFADSCDGQPAECYLMPNDSSAIIDIDVPASTNVEQSITFSTIFILFEKLPPKPTNQYSVSEVRALGRCFCHGHASACVNGSCLCEHNTAANDCRRCLPLYNNMLWSPATPELPFSCQKCDCNNHSEECRYSPQKATNSTPGGICQNCQDHTTGEKCGTCVPYFYENPLVPRSDARACEACDCNPNGSKNATCNMTSGQCYCHPGYTGLKCDGCSSSQDNYYSAPMWHKSHKSARVCRLCKCHLLGARTGQCSNFDGRCACKPGVMGVKCDSCSHGYFNMTAGGCSRCPCDHRGMSWCSNLTGVCRCKTNVIGQRCDRCLSGTDHLSADNPNGCSVKKQLAQTFSTRNIILLIPALLGACFLLVITTIVLVKIWQKRKPSQALIRRFASEQVLMQSRPMATYASNGPCPDGGDTVNLRKISNCMIFENPLLSPTTQRSDIVESGLVFLNETAMDLAPAELQELGLIPLHQETTDDDKHPNEQPPPRVASVQRSVSAVSAKKVAPPKPARSPSRSVHQCESLPQVTPAQPSLQQIADMPPALPARNAIKASVSVPQPTSHNPPRSPKKPPRGLLAPPSPVSLVPSRPLPPAPEKPFLPLHMEAEIGRTTKRPSSMTAIDSLHLTPEAKAEEIVTKPYARFSVSGSPQEFLPPSRSESSTPLPRRVVRRSRQRPRSSSMTALYTQPSKLLQDMPATARPGASTTERIIKARSCGEMAVEDEDDEQVPTLPHRTSASYILMPGTDSIQQDKGNVKKTRHDGTDGDYDYDKLIDERTNTYESVRDNALCEYDRSSPVVSDTGQSYASLGQCIQEESNSAHQN